MVFCAITKNAFSQKSSIGYPIDDYNICWKSPSENSGASMPCGGGGIGLNVWVEKGDVLFYMAGSGCFDENNALLKLGRVRLHLSPNPFLDPNISFQQILNLRDGSIYITSDNKHREVKLHIWVEVHKPMIHISLTANQKLNATLTYESWRENDHIVKGKENNENSYKFAPQGVVQVYKDHIHFKDNKVIFYHRNSDSTIFDVTVHQQKLDSVKSLLYNPLKNLTFGGFMQGENMVESGITHGSYLGTRFTGWQLKTTTAIKKTDILIGIINKQTSSIDDWLADFQKLSYTNPGQKQTSNVSSWTANKKWWGDFWNRSFIQIDPVTNPRQPDFDSVWQAGRNYQLFRYMLACNAYGSFPTKFNGGLFTYDPILVDTSFHFTPDFRNWGGGLFTAQNQRLVYWGLLKSGDYDLLKTSFDFYQRLLKTAELRSNVYWHHSGASFTEQLENFGLPNSSEYGWKRPKEFDPGMQFNSWLEYEWDTALEFCDMILQSYFYHKQDIRPYIPLVNSCLQFFDQHYRYLAAKRGRNILDGNGHLVLFPGSGAETYKMAYNASSTIAALRSVTNHLLQLPDSLVDEVQKNLWRSFLKTIPPIPLGMINGHKTIAPAITWQRINNVESPQLYPVFPWSIYGIGKPNFDIALNTWQFDTSVIKNRNYIGWKQDNIFAARLGLSLEAAKLTVQKLKNGPRRFPAFWGPGFDWVPDHNWGGSGMIGLQEMLLQDNGHQILLFPAWPSNWDVHFKLHTTEQTTVEASLHAGKITTLIVTPSYRKKDIINRLQSTSTSPFEK